MTEYLLAIEVLPSMYNLSLKIQDGLPTKRPLCQKAIP